MGALSGRYVEDIKTPAIKIKEFLDSAVSTDTFGHDAPVVNEIVLLMGQVLPSTDYTITEETWTVVLNTPLTEISDVIIITFNAFGLGDVYTKDAIQSRTVDFYIDFNTGAIWNIGDPIPSTLTVSTTVTHLYSDITTPNGDTLDKYRQIKTQPLIYAALSWADPGWGTWSAGSGGVRCPESDITSFNVQSGGSNISHGAVAWNGGGSIQVNSAPCLVHITAERIM